MNPYRIILPCFVLFIFLFSGSYSQNWQWATEAASTSDYNDVLEVKLDGKGRLFVLGSYSGASEFGGFSLPAPSGIQANFIAQMDTLGNTLWVESFSGDGMVDFSSMIVDANGNCYVSGWHSCGTLVVGNDTYTNDGGPFDFLLVKLNGNGDVMWSLEGEGDNTEYMAAITYDGGEYLYLAPMFLGSLPLNGTTYSSVGQYDFLLCKMDTSGNFVWVEQFGGSGSESPFRLAYHDGSLYMGGGSNDGAEIVGFVMNPIGEGDVLLAKFDTSGVPLWADLVGSLYDDHLTDIEVGPLGNVYVSGSVGESPDFNGLFPSSFGSDDFFVGKISPGYSWEWVKTFGGSGYDFGGSLGFMGDSMLIVTGRVEGISNFDGNIHDAGLFPDAVFPYIYFDGTLGTLKALDGNNMTFLLGFDIDVSGSIYFGGTSSDSLYLDDILIGNPMARNGFVAKYQNYCPLFSPVFSPSDSMVICEGQSQFLEAQNYSAYQWFYQSESVSGATSQTYYPESSGTYYLWAENASGCWASSSNSVEVKYVENPDLITDISGPLDVCVDDFVVCQTNLFLSSNLNNLTWSMGQPDGLNSICPDQSGEYFATYVDPMGCEWNSDTTIFDIQDNPDVLWYYNDLGYSSAEGGYVYELVVQHYVPSFINSFIIDGSLPLEVPDTNQTGSITYVFPDPGNIPVTLSVENGIGCFADSTQVLNIIAGIQSDFPKGYISVFPNPFNESITVQLSQMVKEDISIEVLDLQGRIIFKTKFGQNNPDSKTINLVHYPRGLYFLRVLSENKIFVTPVSKI